MLTVLCYCVSLSEIVWEEHGNTSLPSTMVQICVHPRDGKYSKTKIHNCMLKLFGLVVFRLTSNVAACKIAKPYVNKNGLPTQMTHLEKGELSVESKRFLHGRCVSDVLAPGMEALVYLVVYKLCLGHKGPEWVKANKKNKETAPVTPIAPDGSGGNASSYQAKDCDYYFKIRDAIEEARDEEVAAKVPNKDRLYYFDFGEDLEGAPSPARPKEKKQKKKKDEEGTTYAAKASLGEGGLGKLFAMI